MTRVEKRGSLEADASVSTTDLVAGGHAGNRDGFMRVENDVDGKPRTILKELDENEYKVYTQLATSFADDPIKEFIPCCRGVREDLDEDGTTLRRNLRMANLLFNYECPKVMDIKVGIRTFLESECMNKKPRGDLFTKMLHNGLSEYLTEEEQRLEQITKYKYLSTEDANTTSVELGYRIEGIAGYRRRSRTHIKGELRAIHSQDDVRPHFQRFAEIGATNDGQSEEGEDEVSAATVAQRIELRLRQFSAAAQCSAFVAQHEIIGSSVLLVADSTGHTGVYWIDFAKTFPCSTGITHRLPWSLGNHEDGFFDGLENLMGCWGEVAEALRAMQISQGLSDVESVKHSRARSMDFGPLLPSDEECDNTDTALLSSLSIGHYEELMEEVKTGASRLQRIRDDSGEETIMRSTAAVNMELRRSDGRILAQLGKVENDVLVPLCVLPGSKVHDGQDVRAALQDVIDAKLAPIASVIHFGSAVNSVKQHPSSYFGIDTVYTLTTFHAELGCSTNDIPSLGTELQADVSDLNAELTDLEEDMIPTGPLYKVEVDDENCHIFAWLTSQEFESWSSPARKKQLRDWLFSTGIQASRQDTPNLFTSRTSMTF